MVTNKVQKIIQRLYDDFSTYDIFKLIDYLDITLVESDQLVTLERQHFSAQVL